MDARESMKLNLSEPPGMMAMGPNSYAHGLPNNSMAMPNASTGMQGMHLFNPVACSAPKLAELPGSFYHEDGTTGARPGGGELGMSEPVKKKRGRPRKYGPDGRLGLNSPSSVSGFSSNQSSEPSAKRRGRPPGSGKKQQLDALGSAGISFTPHIISVKAGEDVASKIMAFSQQGPHTVCVLSANGVISNVSLRQPATSGGTATYEGRFEIISLSGSYLLTEDCGTRSRTGGLSVALAAADGRVLGGGVAGALVAASPVQVVMGSFISEEKQPTPVPVRPEPLSTQPQISGFGGPFTARFPSQGTPSESSDGDDADGGDDDDDDDDSGSPLNQSAEICDHPNQHVPSMPGYTFGWSQSVNQQR